MGHRHISHGHCPCDGWWRRVCQAHQDSLHVKFIWLCDVVTWRDAAAVTRLIIVTWNCHACHAALCRLGHPEDLWSISSFIGQNCRCMLLCSTPWTEERADWGGIESQHLFSCPRVCCDWIVWLNYTSIIKIIFPPHKIIYKWWISGCCAAARCLFSRFQTSVCQFWHRCKKMLNNIWRHYALLTYIVSPPLLGHLCTKLITNSLCSLVSKDH